MKRIIDNLPRITCCIAFIVMINIAESGWVYGKELVFYKKENNVSCRFIVELAVTPEEHANGLMFRKKLSGGTGMLFIFEDDAYRAFWMKNTFIALDIIFLNSSWNVVDIHPFAKPLSEKTITSRFPARYVFEINAGEADRCGIQIGTKAKFYP